MRARPLHASSRARRTTRASKDVGCAVGQHSVRSFLRQRTLALTGATGFLAKVFLEKLLWEQPEVRKVFLIITPRGKQSAKARLLEDIVETPLFDRLRNRHGNDFQSFIDERLVPVAGDLGAEGLGLSLQDEDALIEEVEVIVNSAATTTFDERFDTAVNINTLGPRRLLCLSKRCKKLILMCHVSTAFVNGLRRGPAQELPFTFGDCVARELSPTGKGPFLDPYAEVALALAAGAQTSTAVDSSEPRTETFGLGADNVEGRKWRKIWALDDAVRAFPTLLHDQEDETLLHPSVEESSHERLVQLGFERAKFHGWQDTYVFTKAMGEQLLMAERGDLPLVIIRPSIVEGALREPFPGWIEGIRMADPLILAYGKGIIRGFVGNPKGILDLVPVDVVVNVMLASLPAAASRNFVTRPTEFVSARHESASNATPSSSSLQIKDHENDVQVYHVATSTLNPLKFSTFTDILSRHFEKSPLLERRSGKPIAADKNIKIFSNRLTFEIDTWLRQGGLNALFSRLREKFRPGSVSSVEKRREALAQRTWEQLRSMGVLYAPYTSYEARFESDNVRSLQASLSEEEKDSFNFELEHLDWEEYLRRAHIPGLLKHCLKTQVK